ncbi:unnamed protein product [Parajaminaea phylloscopi]
MAAAAVTSAPQAADLSAPSEPFGRTQHIQLAFDGYRSEIDAHNDRRERLIKASRDITNLSKKLIFHLHRIPPPAHLASSAKAGGAEGSSEGAPPSRPKGKLWNDAVQKQEEIVRLIQRVAYEEGLSQGKQDSLRYERNLGGGIEEFIEAVSFAHFLEHGQLITHEQVQGLFVLKESVQVQGSEGEPLNIPTDFLFPIPSHRYLLGISDLTGELMRFATNALGGGGGRDSATPSDPGAVVRSVLNLLRDIRESLEPFVFLVHDMKKKQAVTTTSLRKIEDLWYQITIRMSEFGGDDRAIREMVRRALDGGSGGGAPREDED